MSECSGIKVCALKSILDNNRKTFPAHQSKHSQTFATCPSKYLPPIQLLWLSLVESYGHLVSTNWAAPGKVGESCLIQTWLLKAPDISHSTCWIQTWGPCHWPPLGSKVKMSRFRGTTCANSCANSFPNTGRNSKLIVSSLMNPNPVTPRLWSYHLARILEIQWDFWPGCSQKITIRSWTKLGLKASSLETPKWNPWLWTPATSMVDAHQW